MYAIWRDRLRKPGSWTVMIGVWLLGMTAWGDVPGYLIRTNGQRVPERGQAMLGWRGTGNEYTVTIGGSTTLRIPERDVREVVTPRPKTLEGIEARLKAQPASVITPLEGVLKDYDRMRWDVDAARYLAEAYLKMNQPEKAIEMLERILRKNPKALQDGIFFANYCDALVRVKDDAKLKRILRDAVEQGGRETAAVAQMKRGDIEMKSNNFREALISGYLRTIVLFRDVRHVQPEAHFNAIKCFEQMGQHTHAETLRKKMLKEFPNSPYTERLRSDS